MKRLNLLLAIFCAFVVINATAQSDLPPNAQPGKCYAKCLIPDQYETVTDQILLKEASSRLEVVPAVYGTSTEQVLVKEAYTVLTTRPAQFSSQTEEILVKEAGSRLEYVPPVFETVTEQVLVQPATTKWTKGRANRNCLSANPDDCKVWCLVETAAQYKTVTRQVLRSPATTRETPIPAQYKTVTRAVVSSPASPVERSVPAEYRSITKQVLEQPATTRAVDQPAQYSTITTKRLVKPGGFTDWVEVLCESKVTRATIIAIQQALKAKGYDPGPIDDILGPKTRAALVQYQKDNNLPQGNLNVETLSALGVQ
ncbi:MAG: peptidoglycan-binding domain-containing protein [Chitinophagales bacterium]